MIQYILQSSLGLAIVLAMYYFILEREKILKFNRYFLVFGLIAAHVIPFVQTPYGVIKTELPHQVIDGPISTTAIDAAVLNPEQTIMTISWQEWLLYGYLCVAIVLLIRLMIGMYRFRLKRHRYPVTSFEEVSLVLTDLRENPHSFWRHIYGNKQDYQEGTIQHAVLLHEATHVRQLHSMDIILINLLQAIGWINPLYYLYKRAIQINHEYLADHRVTEVTSNIRGYQHLLIDHIEYNSRNQLASNLNFLITKKRLQMMTKKTSRVKAMAFSIMGMICLTCLIFLYGQVQAESLTHTESPLKVLTQIQDETVAPDVSIETADILSNEDAVSVEQSTTPTTESNDDITDPVMTKEKYYKDAIIVLIHRDGSETERSYDELTAAQRQALPLPPPPPPAPPGYDDLGIIEYKPLSNGVKVYFNYESDITIGGTTLTKGSIHMSKPQRSTTSGIKSSVGKDKVGVDNGSTTSTIMKKRQRIGNITKDEFYQHVTVVYIDKDGTETRKKYSDLTSAEKSALPPIPPPPPLPPGVRAAEHDKMTELQPLPEGTLLYFNHESSIIVNGKELSKGSVRISTESGKSTLNAPYRSNIDPPPPPPPPAPPTPAEIGSESMSASAPIAPPAPPAPPTPPDPIKELAKWNEQGATFYLDDEKVTYEQAKKAIENGVNSIDVRGPQKRLRVVIRT